jgi:type VII secretion integral membrane protein EccD
MRELSDTSAMSAVPLSPAPLSPVPQHVRVSVVGGRTQLDVALPLDVPIASLVPELVKLVKSRDSKTPEAPTDTLWAATRDAFWVLSRLDPVASLQPNETLRAVGVVDGELLQLIDERALSVPTLYDDVVDAAARLNKAAYAGWDAAAARWMSFVGLAVASLVWVYLVVDVTVGAQRTLVVGVATVATATMVGMATLAHRSYGRADVGAAVGWSTIPISTAIVWVLVRGFGDYGVAGGCVVLVALNALCHRAIGTGRWAYLAGGVFFAAGGLAMLGHALGAPAQTVGVVLAVVGVLACLTVPRLTGRLARVEPSTSRSAPDPQALTFETPFIPEPSATDSGGKTPSSGAMPTAEAVWARVHAAVVTRSAIYAGLTASVCCGVAAVLRAEPDVHWPALAFGGVCAAALGVHTRLPSSAAERVTLGVPAVALVVLGGVSAQGGTTTMAWVGFGTLLAIAVAASLAGLRVAGGSRPHRWATAWAYLQYAVYAALTPVALWAAGVYAELEIR